jgi:hypothetical protein
LGTLIDTASFLPKEWINDRMRRLLSHDPREARTRRAAPADVANEEAARKRELLEPTPGDKRYV